MRLKPPVAKPWEGYGIRPALCKMHYQSVHGASEIQVVFGLLGNEVP